MIAGDRVRLKANAPLRTRHPELADAVGIVSSTMHENGDVVLNVAASQFEDADHLEPRLRLV